MGRAKFDYLQCVRDAPHETRENVFHVTGDVQEDLAINTTSAYAAAHEAMISFQALPSTVPKTFIYTGNILNEGPIPGSLTLGVGKIASAHMIELGDNLYRSRNIRFFFVDKRMEDGTPMFIGAGPQAHADMFLALADRTAGDVP
ncbi:hypothetical protein PV05_09269 [Exophiala xenobiotica]|uniref:Uncharacterized protein n=1 Tax=Exophiala xenobiotica TaxID=348802 RepID=A0A0D2EE88_9EURO|nr:uncharacterized protein PV05_09269 [Exophiala xenobiotica]KIW53723.1 hypothetical protein PV05_09269 [Exophiala xenobiotica]